MILVSIIPLVIFCVILLQSDSLNNNLAQILLSVAAIITAIATPILTIVLVVIKNKVDKGNKKVADLEKKQDDLHTLINSGLTVRIDAATDAGITTGILQEKESQKIRQGDVDKGKLEGIAQKEKDDLMKSMPPPNTQPPQYPPPLPQYPDEMSKRVADKVSDKVADRIIEKVGDDVGDKVVEKVVNEVITEKDDELKKKPD